MKYILIAGAFLVCGIAAEAQSNGGVTGAGQSGGSTSGRPGTATKANTPKVATSHGAKDHTPGSPVGTGGAGDNMSGSRDNSASETALDKQNNRNQQMNNQRANS